MYKKTAQALIMEQEGKIVGDLNWDGLQRPYIYYAMIAIFSGLFLSILDSTICNVALPTISVDLQVSSSDSIWVINAFQLIIVMTLLPFSSLGELFGYKRIYLCGVAVFTVGSLFCSLTHTLLLLVIARIFQGVGAAMIMSVNTSLVRLVYPRRYLGRGVGINATVGAVASVAGPTLAAVILSVAPWPWLFAVNVPVGIITFYLGFKYLPVNPTRVLGRRFKWKEALSNALTFGLLIGCIEAYSHNVSIDKIIIGIVLLLFVATIYVRMQLRDAFPILPFDLLKIPIFSLSLVTSILSFTSKMLAMVALPFLLVNTFHYGAVETGLIMTSWPIIIIFVAPLAGSLVGRIHSGILGGIGLMVMSVGCFSLAFVPIHTGYFGMVVRLMICGMGFGFFQSPNNHLLISSAPTHRTGSASGMMSMARLFGQTVGAALVALLFHIFGDTAPHDAMFLAGILTFCGAISSLFRLKVVNRV